MTTAPMNRPRPISAIVSRARAALRRFSLAAAMRLPSGVRGRPVLGSKFWGTMERAWRMRRTSGRFRTCEADTGLGARLSPRALGSLFVSAADMESLILSSPDRSLMPDSPCVGNSSMMPQIRMFGNGEPLDRENLSQPSGSLTPSPRMCSGAVGCPSSQVMPGVQMLRFPSRRRC